jgi:hypothetical protein
VSNQLQARGVDRSSQSPKTAPRCPTDAADVERTANGATKTLYTAWDSVSCDVNVSVMSHPGSERAELRGYPAGASRAS